MSNSNAVNVLSAAASAELASNRSLTNEEKEFLRAMAGKSENEWLKPQTIAAISAIATGALVAYSKGDTSVRAVVGIAAGTGAAYLATKWISEGFGIENEIISKALGLALGIDFGYAMTNLITKEAEPNEAQTEGWF